MDLEEEYDETDDEYENDGKKYPAKKLYKFLKQLFIYN